MGDNIRIKDKKRDITVNTNGVTLLIGAIIGCLITILTINLIN